MYPFSLPGLTPEAQRTSGPRRQQGPARVPARVHHTPEASNEPQPGPFGYVVAQKRARPQISLDENTSDSSYEGPARKRAQPQDSSNEDTSYSS